MSLESSSVHRNLGAKIKIVGLEAYDLLFVLIIAALMNLFFGQSALALPMGFGIPVLIFLGLFFGKKNKPEKYLLHLLRFYTTPGFFSAAKKSKYEHKMRNKIYEQP